MRPPSGAGAGAAAGRCRLPSAAAQRDAALQKARARARRSGAARTAPSAWRCRRRGGCCAAARRRSHARSTSRPRCCRCSRRGCATASHTPCVPLRHLPHRACQVRGVSRGSAACTCALAVRPLLNLVSCPGNARSTKCRPLRQRLLTASRRQAMVAGACKLRAHAAEGACAGRGAGPIGTLSRSQANHLPDQVIGHSAGTWVAFELLRAAGAAGLPPPRAAFLSAMPSPDLPAPQRPWRAQRGLSEAEFKVCRWGTEGMMQPMLTPWGWRCLHAQAACVQVQKRPSACTNSSRSRAWQAHSMRSLAGRVPRLGRKRGGVQRRAVAHLPAAHARGLHVV